MIGDDIAEDGTATQEISASRTRRAGLDRSGIGEPPPRRM
jgi:hypothetical protein